jgi:hypothetical protein
MFLRRDAYERHRAAERLHRKRVCAMMGRNRMSVVPQAMVADTRVERLREICRRRLDRLNALPIL